MSFKRDFECPTGWCDCDTCASMEGQEEDGTVICSKRPKVECPSCGKKPTAIYAAHNYAIKYDVEQGKWVKETGEVIYVCGLCLEELDTRDIENILRQMDEL